MRLTACLSALALIAVLSSCASQKAGGGAAESLVRQQPQAAAEAPALPLPSLADVESLLTARALQPRSASYIPADLYREGEGFDSGLPAQNVTADSDGLSFSPDFPAGGGSFSGLSYAIYSFSIDDYSGNREIFFNWRGEDPAEGSAYLALANWDSQRWRFQQIDGERSGQLPDLAPYFDANGLLLAAIILTGSDSAELDWLRLGSLPPAAQISVNKSEGLTPLTLSFSAAGSSDPDGSIEEYRWDPEGDGSFQISTGTEPVLEHVYEEGGSISAAVRVIDDDGVYGAGSTSIEAKDSLLLLYGSVFSKEFASHVLTQSDGSLVLVGSSYNDDPETAQGVFARINIDGENSFAQSWGGSSGDFLRSAAQAADGSIYVCGNTESYGEGGSDGLLQKWSPEGELLFSKTYGITDGDEEFKQIVVTSDAIYLCGSLYFTTTNRYFGLAMRLGLDGSIVWKRNFIGPNHCILFDLAYASSVQIGSSSLVAVGSYYASGGEADALYLKLDETSGDMLLGRAWDGGVGHAQFNSVSVVGPLNPEIYVTGASQSDMLLGHGNGTVKRFRGSNSTLITGTSLSGRRVLAYMTIPVFPGDQFFNEPVVASFGSDLSIASCVHVNSADFNCSSLASYDASNFVFSGGGTSPGSLVSEYALIEQPESGAWGDVFPSVTSPSLVMADTQIGTGNPGYTFGGLSDQMTVYIGKLE